jgi:hypothetical protein
MKSVFSNTLFLPLFLFFFLSNSTSYAAHVTLTWDPPVDSTYVAGYIIYYGTASKAYSQSIDVGNTTTYTVSSLNNGQIYFFATTAYNYDGEQSVYSNEIRNRPSISPWLFLLLGD